MNSLTRQESVRLWYKEITPELQRIIKEVLDDELGGGVRCQACVYYRTNNRRLCYGCESTYWELSEDAMDRIAVNITELLNETMENYEQFAPDDTEEHYD